MQFPNLSVKSKFNKDQVVTTDWSNIKSTTQTVRKGKIVGSVLSLSFLRVNKSQITMLDLGFGEISKSQALV